ncbi:MAG: glycosyltransferase family 2 protein [Patescibacteria group bacterium]|nr:glycosyltransferase family 2 protein [Patescibacteria group bacterium]MDD5490731.1 glycosyltransferase family 2 protein [Patescibacteria group bacterium]
MKVYIIIVTYNAEKYLPDCLGSIFSNLPEDKEVKVLVIDNNSTDGTVKFIKEKYPEAILIESRENLGFAGGNNIGIKRALDDGADYIYLLNQDTIVEKGWLGEAIKVAEADQGAGAVQSLLLLHPERERINSWGNEIHFLGFGYAGGYRQLNHSNLKLEVKEITYPSGAAVLIKAGVLKEVGLFNPLFFMYHEDLDLGWRMRLGGFKILLAPNSVVCHKYEFSRSIKKYYFMERNRFWVLIQNYKWPTLILFFPAWLVMNIGLLFSSWRGGWLKEESRVGWYYLKARHWRILLADRKTVQAKRKIKDRKILKFFTGKIDFQEVANPLVRFILNPVFNLYFQFCRLIIWW